jgi:protein involved in temperature-dependent protein secretion
MSNPSAAELALKDGDVTRALKLLTEQVRAKPQDAKLRVFMFQLLCVLGQWDRALNQLNVSLELDGSTLPMVQTNPASASLRRPEGADAFRRAGDLGRLAHRGLVARRPR